MKPLDCVYHEKAKSMSRSEGGAPSVKMMHLMVKRRQVPDKKMSLVNETPYDGLATLAEDRQESDFRKQVLNHPPRRSYIYAEPDRLSSPRNFCNETVRTRDFEVASKEAANGDCEEGISKRVNNRRHRRAGFLDTKQLENIRLGPTLTTSLSFKENRLEEGIPEKLTADDSTGKFAYISLDGRLINAELATSATSIGGGLGDEEAQAWEDFAPMQRVLIVAVSAAAAAAAKHRNRKEIDLLLKTVETRENELILLRQQLSELCTQSRTNVSDIHPEPLKNLATRRSPKSPELATTRKHSFDVGSTKVKLDQHEAWSSSKSAPDVERVLSRDSPVNKDVVLVESSINVPSCTGESSSSSKSSPIGDEVWATEEAKWYVNPMVETSQDFYNMSTPERNNSMFSICNPAVQGSFEWTVMRSSLTTRDTDPRLPFTESPPRNTPIQATVGNWSNHQTKPQLDETQHKEHKAMRAVCAAVVLDLRERMLKVLDKEASMVMAALDKSVEDSKAQIASMHLGVASCWNASVPKALAALSLSPSEFDSYLKETQGAASTWSDISKIEESIVSWRQYLETNYGTKVNSERKSPSKWSSVERAVSDERLTSSVCPRCSGQEDEKIELRSGDFACPRNSAAELTEQLIRELDKAATKVTVMERQMRKLEQDAAGCDRKKISKLPECTKQELENQIKSRDDVAELVRQLQSKEVEVADLKKGQQNLKRKSKTRKMEEENILCPMASPKGYGTIYWERAAGLKKTKFHTEPGESKTKSDLLVTINEPPKALMDRKSKEIEEVDEDYLRRNGDLDKRVAGAETSKAATVDRFEEICEQKDCTLSLLKQDVQSLESKELKMYGYKECQSPSVPRALRNSTFSSPNSSSGYGTSQKQRFPDKNAPSPSGSDPILEHMGRFRRDAPSYKGHYRNLHYENIQKHEELTDDGRSERCYDQETSQEYSSPPGSTIGDECSATSLAFSETEVESRLGSEYCSSGDDSRNRSSKDRLSGTKGSSHNRTDLRRAITSTARSVRCLTRGSSKFPTSATSVSKADAGENHSTKSLSRMLPGEAKKPIKDPRTSNLKVQRFVAPSKVVNHRRSSSLDMNLKPNICSFLETSGLSGSSLDGDSPDSQETSAIKRKRWV